MGVPCQDPSLEPWAEALLTFNGSLRALGRLSVAPAQRSLCGDRIPLGVSVNLASIVYL